MRVSNNAQSDPLMLWRTVSSRRLLVSLTPTKKNGPLRRWRFLVDSGRLRYDARQLAVIQELDKLYRLVDGYEAIDLEHIVDAAACKEGSSPQNQEKPSRPLIPRGLYIFGGVGTGKSLCMDLFFNCITPSTHARRVHFHELMLELHQRIHAARSIDEGFDATTSAGRSLAAESPLLCVDEFQVIDGADALVLKRIFEAFWRRGGVVVTTSNRPPRELYQKGPNYKYFEPFVAQLERYCRLVDMVSSVDHRLLADNHRDVGPRHAWGERDYPTWIKEALENALATSDLTYSHNVTIDVGTTKRTILVPRVAMNKSGRRAAVFTFEMLCDKNDFGAADYAAVATTFDVVAVLDVPVLNFKLHDRARRFITLIDVLYESRVIALISARQPPALLFPDHQEGVPSADLVSVRELAWAFRRAASRLVEMAHPAWPHSACVVNARFLLDVECETVEMLRDTKPVFDEDIFTEPEIQGHPAKLRETQPGKDRQSDKAKNE